MHGLPLLGTRRDPRGESICCSRSQVRAGVGGPGDRTLRDNVRDGSNAERGRRDARRAARCSHVPKGLRRGGVDTRGLLAWKRVRGHRWGHVADLEGFLPREISRSLKD